MQYLVIRAHLSNSASSSLRCTTRVWKIKTAYHVLLSKKILRKIIALKDIEAKQIVVTSLVSLR